MVVVTVTLLVAFIVLLLKFYRRPPNFPPGPRGLPLLGYAPFLPRLDPKRPHNALQILSKTYGPVTGFYLGPCQPFVGVVGIDAVKEALHNDDLNGRPGTQVILSRSWGERLGVIFTEGEMWQEQRRFTLRQLRDLGFGKTSIENQMMDEVDDLIQEVATTAQSDPVGVVDFKGIFNVSVVNILWAIVAGRRYRRDDPNFNQLVANVDALIKTGNPSRVLLPVPSFLIRWFPSLNKNLFGLDSEKFKLVQVFIKEIIDEHLQTRSPGDVPRDFIDVYLDEMEKQMNKNPDTSFTDKQLIVTIQDLFIAGSDTTSNSIGFAILYLIHYPEVQHKLQVELDAVCGDSLPTLANRSSLPYMEGFLVEVQRLSSIAPNTLSHRALRETQLCGYNIPEGTLIGIDLSGIFTDPSKWADAQMFRPERHLNTEGKFVKNDLLIPFGSGKRVCLGEPLARNTYYLFVAALTKRFQFEAVPGCELPSLDPLVGLTLAYDGFKAVVTPR